MMTWYNPRIALKGQRIDRNKDWDITKEEALEILVDKGMGV